MDENLKIVRDQGPRKVAILTGASSGVGWAAALRLAEAGWDLCITARRGDRLEVLAEEVRKRGAACLVSPGDVTRQEDVDRTVSRCLERFGRIDALVNNAAVQVYARFENLTWEEIERVNDVNFFGYLRYARAVLPHMRERKKGMIVNVLSVMAQGALQYFSIYAATKHALLGWANCLNVELMGTGVRLSNILLPALNTPLYDHCVSRIGAAPRPLPPIYDVDVAARAIVRAIERPRTKHIPVFLHGQLILWTDYFFPRLGAAILHVIGERGQKRAGEAKDQPENLWHPPEDRFRARGTLKATPAWKRYAPLALAGGAATLVLWKRRPVSTLRQMRGSGN